jgi:CRISPR-associated protein Csx17
MTTTLQPIPLTGCQHDVLGHALKAIGILRAISTCAAPEDRDPDVEGWWNPDGASFMIRSASYPDTVSLVKFFAEKYRPTPIISAWNKSSGLSNGTLSGVREHYECDAFLDCLDLAVASADNLLQDSRLYLASYRDRVPTGVSESLDAITLTHLTNRNDNPLFVNRGQQGRTDIFRLFWGHFKDYRKMKRLTAVFARMCLFAERGTQPGLRKGKGAPFFPEVVKSYNQGVSWVVENMPFCPLDYVLAVEGALAMRGAVSKTLNARARSFATYPFAFEGTETMTDDQGTIKGLGMSLWFPIWTRPTNWTELKSFILDSQARLPRKECRFSSDFARAVRSQGVDAGFAAFQEFRFKMKGARVPWAVSGRFVSCSGTSPANLLNELLAPVDAVGFLDQFEFNRERKLDLHPHRAPVLEAIEIAATEPDANKVVDVLSSLWTLNARLTRSSSFREKIKTIKGSVKFVPPLRCDDWSVALQDLESDPEIEIARALASIQPSESKQPPEGKYFSVEPFLGSLMPLRRRGNKWILPEKPDPPSPQAVWTGIDLARDLSSVLARRVLDSAKDIRPAVVGTWTARLATILQFLRGELNDQRIARLVEALSLIDWRFSAKHINNNNGDDSDEDHVDPIPIAYAAIRSLMEIACDTHRDETGKTEAHSGPHAKVQRTVALLSRQEPRMAAAATVEALRQLAIVGVQNPYGEASRREKPTLAGRDVVQVNASLVVDPNSAHRLAAAVLIPLDWCNRWKLFRAVTLPQTVK